MGEHDELTPADRRLLARARRDAARPARSAMIWSVGLALIVLGGLGVIISATLLGDLTSHGEEGVVVALAATAVLVSAIEVAGGAPGRCRLVPRCRPRGLRRQPPRRPGRADQRGASGDRARPPGELRAARRVVGEKVRAWCGG